MFEKFIDKEGNEHDEILPQDVAKVTVTLLREIAMEVGTEFTIRTGAPKYKVQATGKVTKLLD